MALTAHGRGRAVLGLNGSLYPECPEYGGDRRRMQPWGHSFHDASATLLLDGRIVAAVEEERVSRIKHTNRLPVRAIRECLSIGGISVGDVTHIAYYSSESQLSDNLKFHLLNSPRLGIEWTPRAYVAEALATDLGEPVDERKINFVEHHLCHAVSAYLASPFSDALVVTIDGQGDGLSATVSVGQAGKLTRLREVQSYNSLGTMYMLVIRHLGFAPFDEYKVMGLAPFGDPSRFQSIFESICALRPDGQFWVNLAGVTPALEKAIGRRRGTAETIEPIHQDAAAALQQTLERSVLHLLSYYQRATNLRNLCFAGGVAHNSTLNGKIARAGLFDAMFVPPVANDAGCSLGAALFASCAEGVEPTVAPLTHAYFGRDVGNSHVIRQELERWRSWVNIHESSQIEVDTATALADGAIVGWVQGRSEFGPRALGNRSILADPRPATNKERINELVKMREGFRPFAPSAPLEYADQFFELPANCELGFMSFTVPVKVEARSLLAAVTHIDGSARVQVVSREANERFWKLLNAFGEITGTPILLNTSFNHSVEPIVDSIDDAMTCFLTTGLTHLIIGDWLLTKRSIEREGIATLVPTLAPNVRLLRVTYNDRDKSVVSHYCERDTPVPSPCQISADVHDLLAAADGTSTVQRLLRGPVDAVAADIIRDLGTLWHERLIRLLPAQADVLGDRIED